MENQYADHKIKDWFKITEYGNALRRQDIDRREITDVGNTRMKKTQDEYND